MKKMEEILKPDGSDRFFERCPYNGGTAIKIVPSEGGQGLSEARSFFLIGSHLRSKSLPVPEIYSFDHQAGVIMVEDLGDRRLQDVVLSQIQAGNPRAIVEAYQRVLDLLLKMQLLGGKDFDTDWCWQEPYYDHNLAKAREVDYFLSAFIQAYLSMSEDHRAKEELLALANRVRDFKNRSFFLHRDFQSRNIMVRNHSPWVIDFQAGRLGPLGYDLASLLHDPYVHLPWDLRIELYEYYLRALGQTHDPALVEEVAVQWPVLSVLRLLQVLGAFGFLVKKKNKAFFKEFMKPALSDLIFIMESTHGLTLESTILLCKRAMAKLEDLHGHANASVVYK